jgi:BlaI family penicillinase repressor
VARKAELPELSRAELDVMKELWEHDRLSAREVHEQLGERYGWAYTTTRTVLDRLVVKGHLKRKAFHGIHLYAAAITRPQGLAHMVRDFAERVLESEPAALVALFARDSRLSPAELDELSQLVASAEEREGGRHD